MRSILRISALAVLLVALLLGSSWLPLDDATPQYPLRSPVTPETLRQRGSLRFAITEDSLDRFSRPAESAEFDYDLLRQFATDLHLSLVERHAVSEADAALLLRKGMVDVAVLPFGLATRGDDLLLARPCPSWIRPEAETGDRPGVYAWPDSPELVGLLNAAAVRLSAAEQDDTIYGMYCGDVRHDVAAPGHLPGSGQISRYAGVIAKYADPAGLDWRLVAALIYEESSFEEQAVSAKGARGLMQLMPWVPAEVGVTNISRPEANIQAGVLYLQRLADQFPRARALDRVALVLASYLLGPAHVVDAQELARERGMNPETWHGNMDRLLPLLEDARIRTRAGFAQGRHAVEYVNRILERYDTYRRHLDSEPDLHAAGSRQQALG